MARPVNDPGGDPSVAAGIGPGTTPDPRPYAMPNAMPNAMPDAMPNAMPDAMPVRADGTSRSVDVIDAHRGRHAAPVPPRRRGPLRWIVEVVVVLLIAVGAAIAVRMFVVSPVSVTTDAMADTLVAGDRVLVSMWSSGAQRGEVVAFHVPDNWMPAASDAQNTDAQTTDAQTTVGQGLRQVLAFLGVATPAEDSVMTLRVIAVEGQRIACCTDAGQLELDGVPLVEPYLRPGVPTDQVSFDVVVPEGRVFVLGDDRALARDSRYHLALDDGTIAVEEVIGRVALIAWPFDRIRPVGIETGSAG